MKSLVKWNGNGNNNGQMFSEFPSLFDDFFTRDLFRIPFRQVSGVSSVPAVNIRETDYAYELDMAAPGMEKNDFKVELDQNTLVISAERENKVEEKSEDGLYSRKEFSYHTFKRSFVLPEDLVKADQINANYRDGILRILIPKKETTKSKMVRQIAIV